jgi:hypothetical protein
MKEMEDLKDKVRQAYQEKAWDKAYYLECDSERRADKVCEIFYKIRDIEDNIKALNKNFESSIEEPPFL